MKLKCNHDRRVMVLQSGSTIHRSDGSHCLGNVENPFRLPLTMGGRKVTKMFTKNDTHNIPMGTLVLGVDGDSRSGNFPVAVFSKPITAETIVELIGNPLKEDPI